MMGIIDELSGRTVARGRLSYAPMRDDFERVICQPGTRGLYESHYLKANAPDNAGGLWIKYCVLAPAAEGLPSVVELWAVYWPGPGERPTVVKEVHPITSFTLGSDGLVFDGAGAHLDGGSAWGKLGGEGHTLAWALRLSEPAAPLVHFPHPRLYTAPFPKKKILTPAPSLRFDGTLRLDGREITIDGWRGLRGHNWGREHAYAYAYGNCSVWEDGDGELLLDAFTAKIRLGPVKSPWLSLAVGRSRGAPLDWNDLRMWFQRRSRVEFPRWTLELEGRDRTLVTRWEANPADLAGLRYFHPDGRVSYCYNTKFARLDMVVRGRGGVQTSARSRSAELEFLYPEPLPGIPLHGNLSFPS